MAVPTIPLIHSPATPALRPISPARIDSRLDEDIVRSLQAPHPVTSEKNIWGFWHSGFAQTTPWVRRNVINWVRRLGSAWGVRILDLVPGSPTNVYRFVDPTYLPDAFNESRMTGPHASTHCSDLVRLPLLHLHGGVWIDVGTLIFRDLEHIFWHALADPASPYEMSVFSVELRPGFHAAVNCIIAARKGSAFIERWMRTYLALWEGATETKGFHAHPLLRHLPSMRPSGDDPTMSLPESELGPLMQAWADYVSLVLCFERLSLLEDPSDGFSGPRYLKEHALVFDAMQEIYYADQLSGDDHARVFDFFLAERRDAAAGQDDDNSQLEARKFVEDLLAHSSFMKISHGLPVEIGRTVYLGRLWDEPENADADDKPGTCGAFVRYASVHLEQTRELKPTGMGPNPGPVLSIGVTEEWKG